MHAPNNNSMQSPTNTNNYDYYSNLHRELGAIDSLLGMLDSGGDAERCTAACEALACLLADSRCNKSTLVADGQQCALLVGMVRGGAWLESARYAARLCGLLVQQGGAEADDIRVCVEGRVLLLSNTDQDYVLMITSKPITILFVVPCDTCIAVPCFCNAMLIASCSYCCFCIPLTNTRCTQYALIRAGVVPALVQLMHGGSSNPTTLQALDALATLAEDHEVWGQQRWYTMHTYDVHVICFDTIHM